MILYHGSNVEIASINLSKSMPYKDFGRGFYLTSLKDQAEKMALRTSRFRGGEATVTAFEASDQVLFTPGLNVRLFDAVTIEWALFVINNRNRSFSDVHSPECNTDCKYDIVYGPVGNDDITFLLEQYTNGYISQERLRNGLESKKASDQYSFHTKKAVSLLKKVRVIHVERG